jgi:hypothetical protein
MPPTDAKYDQELTDLLVAYDAELASGNPGGPQLRARLSSAPAEVRRRFGRAQVCLQLVERVWPRLKPPTFCGQNRISHFSDLSF